mmetsp:Transcript_10448/g.38859  ORF Transcript_10448/g.38859 Transcript_10448/m.38859 type:complete len:264 (-) Transcript_10448:7180-7971(-)
MARFWHCSDGEAVDDVMQWRVVLRSWFFAQIAEFSPNFILAPKRGTFAAQAFLTNTMTSESSSTANQLASPSTTSHKPPILPKLLGHKARQSAVDLLKLKHREFSVERREEMREFFDMFEQNQQLSFNELVNIIYALNYQIPTKRLRSILQEITLSHTPSSPVVSLDSKSQDRFISFGSYMDILKRVDVFDAKERADKDDLDRSAKIFNHDGTRIEMKFLGHVVRHIGDKLNEEEYQRIVDELDLDEEQFSNYRKFLDVLTSK